MRREKGTIFCKECSDSGRFYTFSVAGLLQFYPLQSIGKPKIPGLPVFVISASGKTLCCVQYIMQFCHYSIRFRVGRISARWGPICSGGFFKGIPNW